MWFRLLRLSVLLLNLWFLLWWIDYARIDYIAYAFIIGFALILIRQRLACHILASLVAVGSLVISLKLLGAVQAGGVAPYHLGGWARCLLDQSGRAYRDDLLPLRRRAEP